MKKVQVLLSAYNGEKYISQQIESILRQKQVQISLLVRDDGSKDLTWKVLSGYAAVYQNIRIYAGKNIGTQRSYFDLLIHADTDMDYYAFSDQDDVWHPRKLQRAVEALSGLTASQPLLYAGNVVWACEDLQTKKRFHRRIRNNPSFGNALVENICMGCTEVFNKSLMELARTHPPHCEILHDWWLYMTASCFGRVYFDEGAYILYRQHGQNQVGMRNTHWKRWKHRIKNFRRLRGLLSDQAADFAFVYQDVLEKNRELELVAGYKNDGRKKRSVLMENAIYRQNLLDQWIYKILFAINYI